MIFSRVLKIFYVGLFFFSALVLTGCANVSALTQSELERTDPAYWQKGINFDLSGFLSDLKTNNDVVRKNRRGDAVTVLMNEREYILCSLSVQDGERLRNQIRDGKGIVLPIFTPASTGRLKYNPSLTRSLYRALVEARLELFPVDVTDSIATYIDSHASWDGKNVWSGGGKGLVKNAIQATVSPGSLPSSYVIDPSFQNGVGGIDILLEQRRSNATQTPNFNGLFAYPSIMFNVTEFFTSSDDSNRFSFGGSGVSHFDLRAFVPPFDRRTSSEKLRDYTKFIESDLSGSMKICFNRLDLSSRIHSRPLR